MYIFGDRVTYVQFNTWQLHEIVRNGQNSTEFCQSFFLNKKKKKIKKKKKKQEWNFSVRSTLRSYMWTVTSVKHNATLITVLSYFYCGNLCKIFIKFYSVEHLVWLVLEIEEALHPLILEPAAQNCPLSNTFVVVLY